MSLEKAITKDLPEMLKLLKEKFSSTPVISNTLKTDNGDLIWDGELAVGVDVFTDADKKVSAPTKTYKKEDGTEIVVEAGKVVDVKKPIVPAKTEMSAKEIVDEIFKTLPKTDLSKIEATLTELKTALAEISEEKKALVEKVAKFEGFKDEVIGILEQFSKKPSAEPAKKVKTDSVKTIFNSELSMEERIKILNETK